MAIKFLFLGLLCLMPIFFAAPQPAFPGIGDSGAPSPQMKSFFERVKLSNMAVSEFSNIHKQIVEESPKVFGSVLKDPNVLQVKTSTMDNLTRTLRNYLDEVEKAQKGGDLSNVLDIVDQYNNIIDKFNRKKQGNLLPEADIIERSLKENGLENIERTVRGQFEQFYIKLNSELDQYIKGLTESEKENEKDLIDWQRRLNAEQDLEKKIEIVKNLPKPNFN